MYIINTIYFAVVQIYQKRIYSIDIEVKKANEKSMATAVAQKNYTALFPLCSLRNIYKGKIESIEKKLIFKYKRIKKIYKTKIKSILILILL